MTTQTPPILQFPNLPFYGFSTHKEPTYSTIVSTHASGKEAIAVTQAYPVWEFTLTFEFLREQTQNQVPFAGMAPYTELQQLGGLYVACRGRYGRFVYADPTDSSRAASAVGVGNGAQSVFPVPRQLGTFWEPVGALSGVSAVYFNGVEVRPERYGWGPHWGTVNPWYAGNVYLGNTIRFNAPPEPAVVVTADFTFQYLCRFTDDQIDLEEFMFNLWRVQTLKFRSVKV